MFLSNLSLSSLTHTLSTSTSFFGLKLWTAILIWLSIILLLSLLLLLIYSFCRRKPYKPEPGVLPFSRTNLRSVSSSPVDRRLLSRNGWEIDVGAMKSASFDRWISQGNNGGGLAGVSSTAAAVTVEVRRECQYTLKEIETATDSFANERLIGSGDHGVVYLGLLNNTRVAVKQLSTTSGANEEFAAEIEKIWGVRHKNLVKLFGYCNEKAFRILVHEYVDNGNLGFWLHGCSRKVSPLTWSLRMNIILGIAKGLAYLHEDAEPKIIHKNIKSSNILLDQQWTPKISDFCISNLHTCPSSPPPREMFGYTAPEYGFTGVFDEKSDIYSFGILIMEIVSGKAPDSVQEETEEILIEWLKSTVKKQRFDLAVDSKLPEMPALKQLKRILLIALRCSDPDPGHRPKITDVIHMLEPRDLLLNDEQAFKKEMSHHNYSSKENSPIEESEED